MTVPFLIKLQTFRNLEPGWCYGEGTPITQQTVNGAEQLLIGVISCGFDELDVFPGVNGEVAISIYDGSDYLELLLEPDCSVTFIHERNGEEISYFENLTAAKAIAQVYNYKERKKQCVTSEYFTKNIMTASEKGSQAWHLSLLATAAGSRSSIRRAQSSEVLPSANTSSHFMPQYLDLPLCTGSLNRILFLASAA